MNALDVTMHRPAGAGPSHGLARRAMDIILAAAAGMVLAPLMLLIAVALFVEGGWPVFFAQTRLGAGAKPFRMYKFRKFKTTADPFGLALTMNDDSRMTRVGRFLAATKLDELPQLWNVFTGDMAIVGPRPESLAFADCFRGGNEAVLQWKPGLLGPTQVLFRHEAYFYPPSLDPLLFYREVLFPAKATIDLAYYPRRTIASDLVWIMRGFRAVFGVSLPPAASG
jgi:lipopolysaccharide/colanic/teichoic acid biosynthesis glycosyltransferase